MKITKRRLKRIIQDTTTSKSLEEGLLDDLKAQFSKAIQLGQMTASQAKRDFGQIQKMGKKGAEAAVAAREGGDLKEVLEPFLPEIRQKIIDYISFEGAQQAAAEVNPTDFVPAALASMSPDLAEWVKTFETNLKEEVARTISKMSIDIADTVVANLTPK